MKELFIKNQKMCKGMQKITMKEFTKEMVSKEESIFIDSQLEVFKTNLISNDKLKEIILDLSSLKGLRQYFSSYELDGMTESQLKAFNAFKSTALSTCRYSLSGAYVNLKYLRKVMLCGDTDEMRVALKPFNLKWNDDEIAKAKELLLTNLTDEDLTVSKDGLFIRRFTGLIKAIYKKQGAILDRLVSINMNAYVSNINIIQDYDKDTYICDINTVDLTELYSKYYKDYLNLDIKVINDYEQFKKAVKSAARRNINTIKLCDDEKLSLEDIESFIEYLNK